MPASREPSGASWRPSCARARAPGAQIAGVRVAGKTGTAELKDTSVPECIPGLAPMSPPCPPPKPDDPTDTDAWFAAYAPAENPRVAVGVLLVQAGAGGDTAAPVAKQALVAGLKATQVAPAANRAGYTSRSMMPVWGVVVPLISSSSGRLSSAVLLSLKSSIAPRIGVS